MCYVGADGILHDAEIWAEILGADDQRTIEIQGFRPTQCSEESLSPPGVDGETD